MCVKGVYLGLLTRHCCRSSAFLKASYTVSPYEGIVSGVPEGTDVSYTVGCYGTLQADDDDEWVPDI